MEGLGLAANVIAVVDLSAKLVGCCVQYVIDVKNSNNDKARLLHEVTALNYNSQKTKILLEGPHGTSLRACKELPLAIRDSELHLQTLERKFASATASQTPNTSYRALKWPFQRKEIESTLRELRRCTRAICLALQIDQTALILDLDLKTVLDRLPVAEGAAYDSHAEQHNSTCLSNTRVDLLHQIKNWADNPSTASIFWLNGMAGTGKSTISRTVARTFAESGHLSASFFFKRGEADRSSLAKFFTTLAADLAVREPATASHIKDALDADPSITTKNAREQFNKLFRQPLSKATSATRDGSVVVIVDALDECESDDDIKLLILLFSCTTTQQSQRIKIFLTSRPELPPRIGFKAIEGAYQNIVLHEMPETIVERDIFAFLEYELARIRDEYNASAPCNQRFPPNWPKLSDIKSLAKMAVPLFIFAATICRFIADRKYGNPEKQLMKVLRHQTKSHESTLAETYLLVLNQQIAGLNKQEEAEALQEFRTIVGPFVILASPLSTSAVARILGISERTVDDRLALLHSVLSVPQSTDSPVRLLHLSFRDFLVDSGKREENVFWIDEKQAHASLAANCLRILGCLKQDLCDVGAPSTPRLAIKSEDINAHLRPEVQYACLYWINHTHRAGIHVADGESTHGFLISHFLHWIEALSLIGRVSEGLGLIKTLQSLLKDQNSKELSSFLDDATRFLHNNLSAIDSTPLQLYSSLLAFAPRRSKVRDTFEANIAPWISLKPKVEDDWDQCLQTIEGHSAAVYSVAFSRDSALVASASLDNTVRIWRTESGECLQTLKGHSAAVLSVAFSHDSALVASASDDKAVRIWRADSGECLQTLKGHSGVVTSIAFSHNSALVASASWDNTVRIWCIEGECLQMLEGHSGVVTSVAFSHNSSLVASASNDMTVRIWRAESSEYQQIQTLKGHSGWVTSVTFSYNSALVASASIDNTIRIWCANSGECLQILKGHSSGVALATFSHDSSLIASASNDNTIRIWRTNIGKCVQTLKGHYDWVTSVAFSHNSALVVSASNDKTVRIWRAETSEFEQIQMLEGHSGVVESVAFSDNSSLVASVSNDKTIRIWRANSGECLQTLKGHSDKITSVAFSYDSMLVASASWDNTVRIWCADSGKCLQILEGHCGMVTSIAFSYDSSLMASASNDNTVRIWCAKSGKCLQTLNGHGAAVLSVVFSYNSALIASASSDNTVRIWCADSGECLQILKGHSGVVTSIAFSYDSLLIASASNDNTLRIWRTDLGECQRILKGHSGWLISVAFSYDSAFVASASNVKTVRIWHVDSEECLHHVNIGVNSLHLSFDPHTLHLHTDVGPISLHGMTKRASVESSTACHSLCGISSDGCWVTWNGENLLRLPVEARLSSSACWESTVVIGTARGRVMFIRISPQELPNLLQDDCA